MRRNGFTLIEILLAVIVIGVFAGVAIPTWQALELRGQIDDGLDRISGQLDGVDRFYRDRGRLPRHSGELGLIDRLDDDRVEYLSWRRSLEDPDRIGYIDVQMTLQPLGGGLTPVVLEARVAGGELQWRCVSARRFGIAEERSVADFYLPSRCRQGGKIIGP